MNNEKQAINKYWSHKILISCILVVIAIIYGRVRNYEFINYDDGMYVYKNNYLAGMGGPGEAFFWKNIYFESFPPVTLSALSFISRFAKPEQKHDFNPPVSPSLFHWTSLILHSCCVLLVYLLLYLITRHRPGAFFGALLFALHPVQVDTVTWISNIKGLLATLYCLLSIIFYYFFEHHIGRQKFIFYGLSFLMFILAILSKPVMVSLPLIIFALTFLDEYSPQKSRSSDTSINTIRDIIKQIKLSGYTLFFWLLFTIPVILVNKSAEVSTVLVELWQRPIIAGNALFFYFKQLLVPWYISPEYSMSYQRVLENNWSYLTAFISLILIIVLFKKYRVSWINVGMGIFILGCLPLLGFLTYRYQFNSTVADRYLYLSMLGPALLLSRYIAISRFRYTPKIVFLVLVVFAIKSFVQTGYWKNSEVLYTYIISKNDLSWLAHNNLANYYEGKNKRQKAITHYQSAIKIRPDYAEAHNNLGSNLDKMGKTSEAKKHIEKALQINPNSAAAHNNLGIIYFNQRNYGQAKKHYLQTLKLNPDIANAHFNLANIFANQRQYDKALEHFHAALKLNPRYAPIHYYLGRVYYLKNDYSKARYHYQQTLKLDPAHQGAKQALEKLK
ncbi:MAG: tetratricopeptide repeat protein [Fibrobacteria bacterium]|nr:tetratricopeptide repeat protein [Fibrobacteria bacterium]